MLSIEGRPYGFCDGISRRNVLRIGGLALGGLSLPQILEAESRSGGGSQGASGAGRSRGKSVIMIFLPGGPPHQDTFDLKMDAPREIRGEFNPIKTNVPGIEICELLPKLAARMDKLIAIRSVVGSEGSHSSYQCVTGRSRRQVQPPPGGWPEMGAVTSSLKGAVDPSSPAFVNLAPIMRHKPYNAGFPGFLGVSHAPFRPDGEGKGDLVLNGVTLERLGDRRAILKSFDRFRRSVDQSGLMEGIDSFNRDAFGVLTSSKLAAALDLDREDPRVRQRYGKGTADHQGDGAPRLMEHFLAARRLVEAGVRCVTVSFSFWDWHGKNFPAGRSNIPALDQGVAALIDDLYQRGLDEDVSVVVWGEFGRTPKINNKGGRDHWPQVSCALLTGGGMRTGQVIGATNRLGEEPASRPVHFQEIFATLYHNLGIDVGTATVTDLTGRPHYLVDPGFAPLPEVI